MPYAARSSSIGYNPSFDHLSAATLQMQAQTILTVAAMENAAMITAIGEHLCDLVPSASSRVNYLADLATREFGRTISGFRL